LFLRLAPFEGATSRRCPIHHSRLWSISLWFGQRSFPVNFGGRIVQHAWVAIRRLAHRRVGRIYRRIHGWWN
jgi:hypothetical protein